MVQRFHHIWACGLNKLLFFVGLFIIILPLCAHAALGISATSSSSPSSPQLTAQEANQLVNILTDDSERRKFVSTLKGLIVVSRQDQQSQSHTAKSASAVIKLRAQGLGLQFLEHITYWRDLTKRAAQLFAATRCDVHQLAPWWTNLLATPSLQTQIMTRLLYEGLFILLSGAVYLLMAFLLRRPQRAMERLERIHSRYDIIDEERDRENAEEAARRDSEAACMQPPIIEKEPAENPDVHAEQARAEEEYFARLHHQGALAHLLTAVRRAPYALACLLIDLIPLLAIPVAGVIVSIVSWTSDDQADEILRNLSAFLVIGGALILIARVFFAPKAPWLRLATVSSPVARYLYDNLACFVTAITFAAVLIETLACFELPNRFIILVTKILALLMHSLLALIILRSRPFVRAFLYRIAPGGPFGSILHIVARIWWIGALFFDFGLWTVWAAEVHHGYALIWLLFFRSVGAAAACRLLSVISFGLLERLFRSAPNWQFCSERTRRRLQNYYGLAQKFVGIFVIISTVILFSLAWGAPLTYYLSANAFGGRFISSATTVGAACVLGLIAWEGSNIAFERHARRVSLLEDGQYRVARVRTLVPMVRIVLFVVLVAIILLTALSEIGINIAPLLAGASIFGVALGFGSQKLIQDFISGIFLLLENALTVGDEVTLNDTYGVIEHLSMRTVHIRADDGSINIFPFSSLTKIVNYNRDFARAMIAVDAPYDVDTDAIFQLLKKITADMRADKNFGPQIIDDFQLWGVDTLNETTVTIRGTLPSKAKSRWPVQREFYRRLKRHLPDAGVCLPHPTEIVELVDPHRSRAGRT